MPGGNNNATHKNRRIAGRVYIDKGQPNSHWVVLYKMDNDFYYIFDSYDHSKKTLPIKGHKINYAKRIVFYKKDAQDNGAQNYENFAALQNGLKISL